MFLSPLFCAWQPGQRGFKYLLVLCILWSSWGQSWAQTSILGGSTSASASNSSSINIATKLCQPSTCFGSVAARQQFAKNNSCYFLEDVCSKTPASEDNKGAKPEDKDLWGKLWSPVSGGFQYGYEFGKGLYVGLKEQISDLLDLITNPLEVAQGLIELGTAFYKDPKGTLATLAELLGHEAVDTITRATQCGSYDLGRVVGQYVSPVVALKLAGKLTQYSGDVKAAVRATKTELGCASFAAGTAVLTAAGPLSIERIAQNDKVLSRDDRLWRDAPQSVTNTFGREAPSYRVLRTEQETYRLTDEHPLWVQGKGWTQAKDITDDDVLASLMGDVRVRSNEAVQQPLRVYNFSVGKTPNYFVGSEGLWAHNAKCDLSVLDLSKRTADFEKSLVQLPPGERVAKIREAVQDIVITLGWKRDKTIEKLNLGRTIYRAPDGTLYSLDTQHARWESINGKTGRHMGESYLYEPSRLVPNSIVLKGDHDLRVR